jgi:cytochrome c oxidase cbb3-type subunit III
VNYKSCFLSSIVERPLTAVSRFAGAGLLICVVTIRAQTPRQTKQGEQSPTQGRETFEAFCAGCHGLDGRGGQRGPDIVGRPEVRRLSDAENLQFLKKGNPGAGMPAFGSLGSVKLKALLDHLRTLQGKDIVEAVAGHPRRGKTLFFGKARCSECHMVNGVGGFDGSDLSVYGLTRAAAEIRSTITNPGSDPDARRKVVVVTARDGQKFSGIVRNEDNFSLQLQSLDGAFHLLARSEVEHLEFQPGTLMPADYGSTLSPSELDDLVSYLVTVAKTEKTVGANKSKWQEKEKD